jgi:type IV pilus assembly protein PilE
MGYIPKRLYMKKKKRGFSLSELVVTLVMVAILAIIGLPIYRGYVKKGIATEGKALLGEINAAQQIYYTRHGQYYAGSVGQTFGGAFGVDARRNKYFTSYNLSTDAQSFTAVTPSKDGTQSLTLVGSFTTDPKLIER